MWPGRPLGITTTAGAANAAQPDDHMDVTLSGRPGVASGDLGRAASADPGRVQITGICAVLRELADFGTIRKVQTPKSWHLMLGGLYLILAWVSSAAVAAADRFGYAFAEPINRGQLVGDMFSVDMASVARTYLTQPDFRVVNIGLLVTAVVALGLAASAFRHRNRVLVALAVAVIPVGLLGMFSLVQTVGQPDGEWLIEGWPMLEVAVPWSIALSTFAIASVRRERSTVSHSAERLRVS